MTLASIRKSWSSSKDNWCTPRIARVCIGKYSNKTYVRFILHMWNPEISKSN